MNKQEFKQLNGKILAALKEHTTIVEAGVKVSHHPHPFYGEVWVIGSEAYAIQNDGDVATWSRVQ